MKMLTDNAVNKCSDDMFGFAPYANILSDTIIQTQELPFSIGIFAQWGAGKSSLMNMVRDRLSQQTSIKSIWFNPWKYDKKEDLWNALIQSILYGIVEDIESQGLLGKHAQNKVIDEAKSLAKSTAWMLLKKGLSTATAGAVSGDGLQNFVERFSETDEIHYKHINHFEENFSKVVADYTNNGKLVIFVDDLDRCMPENAITVLESLKLFIGDANCIFVLGMDQIVVEQGLHGRFSEDLKVTGRDYLDKMIQVPFFLPPVPFEYLKSALQNEQTEHFDEHLWTLAEQGLSGNPRKTKRFVNSVNLLTAILKNRSFETTDIANAKSIALTENVQSTCMAKLLVFQMAFPDFYQLLTFKPEAWEIFEKKLLGEIREDTRNKIIEKYEFISPFWEDTTLKEFMIKTENKQKCPAPTQAQVMALIRVLSLVSIEPIQS